MLVDVGEVGSPAAAAAAFRSAYDGQLANVVPGHRTVLVEFAERRPPSRAELERVLAAGVAELTRADSETVTIPVVYDGEDLGLVAAALGASPEALVARHLAGDYEVAFLGFSGFPYLLGGPPELVAMPRRPEPRVRVPAGSVAVAAGYCGIYPGATPGGWNLLGRTDVPVFVPDRMPPAVLCAGDRVRFTRAA